MWLITRHQQEAEEIAQDAYVRVLERWDRVCRLDDPVSYLFRTATNVWRSRGRRASVALRKLVHHVPPERDDIAAAEAHVDVLRAIAELTARQRAALVLTDLVGLTSDEAAGAMGCRPSTVRVLAARGRAAMKERMTS
jgi:RNA polymerase sigma-70 factor (ECF subfamily)